MISSMPKKLIYEKDIHNWREYSSDLDKYPLIKKHLGSTLKRWVHDVNKNPLEIKWIQDLLQSNLKYLNNWLYQLEEELEGKDFELFLDEIRKAGGTAEGINRKIDSLHGEIHAYRLLVDMGYTNIGKETTIGDWKNDTKIISVKTKTAIDQNYQLIENKIRSLYFVEENSKLREFSYITLENQLGVDYDFLNQIMKFLQSSFLQMINSKDTMTLNPIVYNKLIQPKLDKNGKEISKIEIDVCQENNPDYKNIQFNIDYKCQDKKFDQSHKIEITLESTSNQLDKFLNVDYDTNGYLVGTPMDLENLSHLLSSQLLALDNNFSKNKTGKEFLGWINIVVSRMHKEFVKNHTELIEKVLSPLNNNRTYKIFGCLLPQFGDEMKESIIFQL